MATKKAKKTTKKAKRAPVTISLLKLPGVSGAVKVKLSSGKIFFLPNGVGLSLDPLPRAPKGCGPGNPFTVMTIGEVQLTGSCEGLQGTALENAERQACAVACANVLARAKKLCKDTLTCTTAVEVTAPACTSYDFFQSDAGCKIVAHAEGTYYCK